MRQNRIIFIFMRGNHTKEIGLRNNIIQYVGKHQRRCIRSAYAERPEGKL